MLRLQILGPTSGMPLQRALAGAPWDRAGIALVDSAADVHLLVAETAVSRGDQDAIIDQARLQGALLLLAGPTLREVADGPLDLLRAREALTPPVHEIRVRALGIDWPRGEVSVRDTFPLVGSLGRTLLSANVAYADHPVLSVGDGLAALGIGNEPSSWADVRFLQLLHQALLAALSRPNAGDIGVGLLGFGAIGAEHASGIAATAGLRCSAVCDLSEERLTAARALAPDASFTRDPEALLEDDGVGAIIVSTPPSTHAAWALRALEAGRHVILEKPMALTTDDCDAVLASAEAKGLTALVYQNRRFDPDFVILQDLVNSGRLGDVFHAEAFIGGYGHPCNYWHSEASVSGGALFDWGSHVVDQLLQVLPGEISYVSALNHKRVWHDVTNADHARLTIVMADGREATFTYSDLAAALKPRWYVLGTRGAVTGDWRYERVVSRSATGTLTEDLLAPADAPPVMRLSSPDGSVTVLAPPQQDPFPFHADLSLALRYGVPSRVRPQESRRVVAVLQAAEESAALAGQPVKTS